MTFLSAAGHVLMTLGGVILFTSGLGIFRMPDVWNRLHAGTKATTLGTMLFLAGTGCLRPGWIPRLFLIVLFVILTNPVSGHALARAVHMMPGEKPDNLRRDDLKAADAGGEAAE
ncbi:MAG: monovalent cation/H(+) antiporter subunit G [Candidatus Aegiribacteria sp.]